MCAGIVGVIVLSASFLQCVHYINVVMKPFAYRLVHWQNSHLFATVLHKTFLKRFFLQQFLIESQNNFAQFFIFLQFFFSLFDPVFVCSLKNHRDWITANNKKMSFIKSVLKSGRRISCFRSFIFFLFKFSSHPHCAKSITYILWVVWQSFLYISSRKCVRTCELFLSQFIYYIT